MKELGVKFGNYHSYDDWKLILTEADIGTPAPKTVTVDVPGANGVIDMTETSLGSVPYENRTLTFEFSTTKQFSNRDWENLLSEIAGDIHGKRIDIILDDDKYWKYSGRCTIDTFATDREKSEITIVCDCDPYKYSVYASNSPWLWDPFSFVDGVAKNEGEVEINSTTSWTEVTIAGYPYNTTLQVICTNTMTMQYGGVEYDLSAGTNTMYDIKMTSGANVFYFKGKGTVTLITTGGRL